jgi:hypothetical protein
MTAGFVGFLIAHLDLPIAPKQTLATMFRPILAELRRQCLLQLFDDNWIPRFHAAPLRHLTTAKGARNYIHRVSEFYEGVIEASDIAKKPILAWLRPDAEKPLPTS